MIKARVKQLGNERRLKAASMSVQKNHPLGQSVKPSPAKISLKAASKMPRGLKGRYSKSEATYHIINDLYND